MAKLVTKFKYYKPFGKKKFGGYAQYLACRNGVDKSEDTKKYTPSTVGQKKLIEKILKDFPDSKDMLEFDDYISSPTNENASEFISRAIEDNFQYASTKKTYADYIATRPRAEKLGKHGLFSNDGDEIILSKVSDELNAHEGNMWTMIVSLRREDAERLNYDNATAWRELLRAHTSELSDALKIPLSKLKWYAAFHNESHHPHIHLLAYTDDPQVGFLTKQGINNMRSALGNDIFQEDLQHIFTEQTERRNALKKDWHELLEDILKKISESEYQNPEVEQKLLLLSEKLSRTKGKKVYGYLKKDVKDLIDSIVDLLAEAENISKLYDLWYGTKYCKASPTLDEKALQEAIVRAVNRFHAEDAQTYLTLMKATIGDAIGLNGSSDEIDLLERRIDALNRKMLTIVNESVQNGEDMESHEDEFKEINAETEQLKNRIKAIRESECAEGEYQQRLAVIQKTIEERQNRPFEYDDSVVRQMIECIKVFADGKLTVIFGGGYEVGEQITPDNE